MKAWTTYYMQEDIPGSRSELEEKIVAGGFRPIDIDAGKSESHGWAYYGDGEPIAAPLSAAKAKADYARSYAEAESERGAFGKALCRLRVRSLGPADPGLRRFMRRDVADEAWVLAQRDAHATVERSNATVPVGTPVRFWPGVRDLDPERRGETRTLAQVTAAGVPVVWITGYASSIALTHVEVMP